jgi:metal-responsive CopG/Arc/MetJ family transcriptional regulator
MGATKTRISVTIIPYLAKMLDEIAEQEGCSKSEIVERSLKEMMDERMTSDAKALAKMTFDDLPSEEDWLILQNEAS